MTVSLYYSAIGRGLTPVSKFSHWAGWAFRRLRAYYYLFPDLVLLIIGVTGIA